MIHGIGIDVVEPRRIARLMEKYGERFARRVLTQLEWPGYLKTVRPYCLWPTVSRPGSLLHGHGHGLPLLP